MNSGATRNERAIEMNWQMLAWARLADAAAGSLIVMAVGSLAARLCRQPVPARRIIVLTLLGGVAVPCLNALPVAPHWSAGLLPAPAVLVPRPDDAARANVTNHFYTPEPQESRRDFTSIEPSGKGTATPRTASSLFHRSP